MILAWHNGEEWSDTRIVFLDCEEAIPDDVADALRFVERGGHVVIVAPSVEWREPSAKMTARAYLDSRLMGLCREDDADRWVALPAYVKGLFDQRRVEDQLS